MADVSHPAYDRAPRWAALDFWRGYLLCTIFINHVPGNSLEALTQKNFGFSDSAEGFVFLSGVSLALAFGRRCAAGEWMSIVRSLWMRCAKLYGAHVLLSLLGLAIFAAGAALLDREVLLQVHGRDLAVKSPASMLLGVVSLGHQFGYFNILPMYILMLVIAPALLWLGRHSPWRMVAASFVFYFLAVTRGWNLPTWPQPGTWFFDPLAWQFMMACGMAVGLVARRSPIPRHWALGLVALLVVGFGAFSVTDGFSLMPGFRDETRMWAEIDKTTLGAGRIVHFLSLAYLVYALRVADWLKPSILFTPVAAIGRHSLLMFAALSLMAALGQVIMQGAGHTPVTDVAMVALGLWVLCLLATWLDRRKRSRTVADGVAIGGRDDRAARDFGFAIGSR